LPTDYRENIFGLTKLYYSCKTFGFNAKKEFQTRTNKTCGQGKELIEKFADRKPVDKTLQYLGSKTKLTLEFDVIQVDFDNDYLTQVINSLTTDKQLMINSKYGQFSKTSIY